MEVNFSTPNQFNVLEDQADSVTVTPTDSSTQPMPVMLRVSNDYNLHLQAVNSAFPNTTSTLAHGYIKNFPEDDKTHKGIIDLLRDRNADFYVILPSNERPVKIVIKGIPPTPPLH
ncbi:hypothetical protein AVEN_43790-1 [Araneus ventricosus]|uniref:Pre-C2HC domain-containing protein n=1 Tax=Araneus ventricosus TaxID=182803 RepID=A0A4Y2B5Z4_ARAVE|nr:hypothetical protein AVEN_43790-1 [Araneus ventricosus]